jgi:hypothetical protein
VECRPDTAPAAGVAVIAGAAAAADTRVETIAGTAKTGCGATATGASAVTGASAADGAEESATGSGVATGAAAVAGIAGVGIVTAGVVTGSVWELRRCPAAGAATSDATLPRERDEVVGAVASDPDRPPDLGAPPRVTAFGDEVEP